MYKYKLYAIRFDYKEYHRTFYRRRKLTSEQRDVLGGKFADKLAAKYNCNFIMFGCVEYGR